MSAIARQVEFVSPERVWTDASGSRWRATMIWYPLRPAAECEIQVDGDGVPPERVLCVGLGDGMFPLLSTEELELIRRAAHARCGIVWVDPRDGQVWWVREGLRDPSRVQPTYANGQWSGIPRFYLGVPITFLKSDDHQRMLDDARRAQQSALDSGVESVS
jgi:hypothetical protein